MGKKFVHLHMHDDNSNGGGYFEVVTKTQDYIDNALEQGSPALCITNHGNIVNWVKRKQLIEAAGLKYIHGIEAYVTHSLEDKVRDNYHLTLLAKNYEGVKEINELSSRSWNREDGHFYFNPRISFDEIKNTSDNIIILTACLGNPLWQLAKNKDKRLKEYVDFFAENKHRVYLEVQPHQHEEQIIYNKFLLKMAEKYDMKIVATNDVHALNKRHDDLRGIMKKSKKSAYAYEDDFVLTAKSRSEMYDDFKIQGVLSEEQIESALDMTLEITDSIEEFPFERSIKFPQLYDNPEAIFQKKILEGVKKRGLDKLPREEQIKYAKQIKHENETYKETGSINYMLLEEMIKSWGHERKIYNGYGRGSVSGSIIAYLLGITEMDSLKHNLNFERFMNKERMSLPDIDTDYYSPDRLSVQKYLLEHDELNCASIITINTLGLKGAMKDVARTYYFALLDSGAKDKAAKYAPAAMDLVTAAIVDDEEIPPSIYEEYKEIIDTAKELIGVCQSFGRHAAGVVVSTEDIDKAIGVMTVKDWDYKVSSLTMKEIDFLNFVKLDVLGLDNIGLINLTSELANLPRLTPDSPMIDFNDDKVVQSMAEENLLIFQYEGDKAGSQLRQFFSPQTLEKVQEANGDITYIDMMTLLNAGIRPSGASYIDDLLMGKVKDNGHPALNDFLKSTMGYLAFQETQTQFLVDFCGWSVGEADVIRRGIGKKDQDIMDREVPKIKPSFVKTMVEKYGDSLEHAEAVADSFIQVFLDSANYGFSINHARAYTYVGYISGWLRYYYPLEFITAALIIWNGNKQKTVSILDYADKNNIKVKAPRFRKSKGDYFMSHDEQVIYQGIKPIRDCNIDAGDKLFSLKDGKFSSFADLLLAIFDGTSLEYDGKVYPVSEIYQQDISDITALDKDIKKNPDKYTVSGEKLAGLSKRNMLPLIYMDYFEEFGNAKALIQIYEAFNKSYRAANKTYANKAKSYKKILELQESLKDVEDFTIVEKLEQELYYTGRVTKSSKDIPIRFSFVLALRESKTRVSATVFNIHTGKTMEIKVGMRVYRNVPFKEGDIIEILEGEKKPKSQKVGGEWVKSTTETDFWVKQMSFIRKSKMKK